MILLDKSGVGNNQLTKLLIAGTGTTFTDVSAGGGGKTITNISGVSWSSGQQVRGRDMMYFSGNGMRLSIPNAEDIDLDSPFTIDYWVYIIGTTAYKTQWTYPTGQQAWFTVGETSYYNTTAYNAGFTTDNFLYHVAVVHDGTNLRVYLNGVQTVTNVVALVDHGTTFYIGAFDSGSNAFTGYIVEYRITDRVLYNRNFTPPTRWN